MTSFPASTPCWAVGGLERCSRPQLPCWISHAPCFLCACCVSHRWKRLWLWQLLNYAAAYGLSRTTGDEASAAAGATSALPGFAQASTLLGWVRRVTCAGSGCNTEVQVTRGYTGAARRDGYHAICFYTCAWCLAQLVCGLAKARAGRRRPVHVLSGELGRVRRTLRRTVCVGLAAGRNAIESFPSGDTAGAGVFAACLWRCAPRAGAWAVGGHPACALFAVAAGFGRMFFHAHHLLDVAAGASVGAASTLALDAAIAHFSAGGDADGWRRVGFVHVLGNFAAFWCLYKCLQVAHHPLPEDLGGGDGVDVFAAIMAEDSSTEADSDSTAEGGGGTKAAATPAVPAATTAAPAMAARMARGTGPKRKSFLGWTSLVSQPETRKRATSRAL